MVQYCRKCGKELEDEAEFCEGCGFKLNENPTKEKPEENKTTENKKEFVAKLPAILAIVGIIVSIAEGLGTPMLMGWDNILTAMGIGIIGGIIGILWKNQHKTAEFPFCYLPTGQSSLLSLAGRSLN